MDRLKTMSTYVHDTAHALSGTPSYFHCFGIFAWMGKKDSNTLHVDECFCQNKEKNLSFHKYLDV